MASNVLFTKQGGGNATLTVVETTIGNLMGPFLSPVLIRMYLLSNAWYTDVIPSQAGGYTALSRRVFMQFGLSIYLPMTVGQVVRHFFPRAVQKVFLDWNFSKIGSFCMLAILWQTFDRVFAENVLTHVKPSNLVFIIYICIANWGIWLAQCFLLSMLWLGRKDTIAACMCASAKTLALGVRLSFLLFEGITENEEAKLQVPMLLFQVFMLALGSLSTLVFRRWVPAEEKQVESGEQVLEVVTDAEATKADTSINASRDLP
ncbi:hypothetical protein AYO20_11284 [Fonsecaea nubica]|uniref:Uncharacterized protein n=1 Tax=Fonsecaea nubica TaxID=856822 RepID=A0A178BWN7_9EURO|nr:hypothetical protein AYO20_11284 [Fonsecaea nubica]OAL22048.1 hypothetical protein AYO20_11284 [Fonsecaea nubica]